LSIFESIGLAFKNIVSSKTRTFLTMLGIIIGVAAVIVIVGLGNGLEGYVTESFSDMGTNTLTVSVMSRGSTRTMEVEDMYDIVAENSEYLDLCSPTASMMGSVKIGSETTSTSTTGVSEDYLSIKNYTISKGRNLQYSDILLRSRVCVVGAYVDQAYYGGNAVGQSLRVGGTSLKIVGVIEQQSDDMDEGGTDDCLFLPYSTASRLSGRISSFVITVKSEDTLDESKTALEDALYKFFDSDDFYTVISMAEMLETMTSMINIMVGVLAGIAAISLVVGGIGIMNIMLVSVTERTREIGIRKSLGAKERYILQQFVIEAAATSALGGVVGILLGYLLSKLASMVVTQVMGESLTVSPTSFAVLVAFGISVGIGFLFGYLPEKKAALLNPIDALHYE
jgi:putative ABC transport system permease protein